MGLYKIHKLSFFLLLLVMSNSLFAQSCCTGSAPITGAYRITSTASNKWGISLINDFNYIGDVYAYDTKLDNNNVSRITNTLLWQTNYGLSDRLSLSVIVPFISKSEQINARGITKQVSSNTIGDLSVLLQYALINKHKSFNMIIGTGIKLPTAPTQITDSETQTILIPSLQPGTGSYDYLFLSQFQFSMPFRQSLSLSHAFTYQLTGTSANFATFATYKFGNEFRMYSTAADQFVWFNKIFTPSLSLIYSNRLSNTFDGYEDANTGGNWWYISPGMTFQLNSNIGFLVQADVPVVRKVIGFQIITTYIIRGGIYINI
jgi:hypothetical protein